MTIIGYLQLVYGILICFWGFKLFRLQLGISGFLVGVVLSYSIITLLGQNILLTNLIGIGILIVSGIIGAILSFKLYNFTVFITFSGLSYSFIVTLLGTNPNLWSSKIIVLILSGIIGILCVKLNKKMIIVLNAIYGGVIISQFIPMILPIGNTIAYLICIIIIALGMSYQFKTVK